MFVFRVLNTVPYTNQAGAKDLIAGLHSFVTSNLLVGLAVLVSFKQFGGKPIECMVPTDFTGAWVQYAENYCWSQQSYFIPFDTTIVEEEVVPGVAGSEDYVDGITIHNPNAETKPQPKIVKKGGQKVSYYQWMPFFLLFEAACFRMPCFIWKYFASQSGMQVGEILRVATDESNTVPDVKRSNIHALSVHLRGVLRFQKRLKLKKIVPHKYLRFLNIKYSMYYVTFIYFVAKVGFLLNVGVQAKLLNEYVLPKENQKHFGFDVWKSIWTGGENDTWEQTGVFPRVTLCDFEIREMGNIQVFTIQCVLLLNLLTEKIFLILWAWYLLLGAFTMCNLASWAISVLSETSIEHFVVNHLEMCETPFDKENIKNRDHVTRFINKYLGMDGTFLLLLIAQHADVVFTTELVGSLFKSHYDIEERRMALKQMNQMIPLIRPDAGKAEEGDASTSASKMNTPAEERRRRNTRQSSISTALRRYVSVEAPENVTKRFDESSSDDDEQSKKGSKKSSPKKSKTNTARTTPNESKRPSLASIVHFDGVPATSGAHHNSKQLHHDKPRIDEF